MKIEIYKGVGNHEYALHIKMLKPGVLDEIHNWCTATFKDDVRYAFRVFYFRHEKDRAWFIMRWQE